MNEKAKAIVPESPDELQKIELMFTHVHEHLEYMTKLLESVVEQFNLGNKQREKASEVMKMNANFMESLFADKDFKGKDQFKAYINKIMDIGVGK